MNTYPDLTKLSVEAKSFFTADDNRKNLFEKAAKVNGFNIPEPEFSVQVFSQIWGTSGTAFVKADEFAPQIITAAYTVVFHEPLTDSYIVFVDNKFCYIIEKPGEDFKTDLTNHSLKSVEDAEQYLI